MPQRLSKCEKASVEKLIMRDDCRKACHLTAAKSYVQTIAMNL